MYNGLYLAGAHSFPLLLSRRSDGIEAQGITQLYLLSPLQALVIFTVRGYQEDGTQIPSCFFLVTAHLQAYEIRDFQSSLFIWARVDVLDISNGHHDTNFPTLSAANITDRVLSLPSTVRQSIIRLLVLSKPSSKLSSKLHHPQHV
jgi:hypothetical protein